MFGIDPANMAQVCDSDSDFGETDFEGTLPHPVPIHGVLGCLLYTSVVGRECPKKVVNLSLPDAPVITGTSKEVFDYYGLNAQGIAKTVKENM